MRDLLRSKKDYMLLREMSMVILKEMDRYICGDILDE